jgi:8-hydroxy-5-deazaflavin:NADPH oxidoreductase
MPTPIVRPSADTTSTANRSLRPSTISSSRARAVQRVPAGAAATCLTHTSNPTVALPGSSRGYASIEAVCSIIAIIAGVDSTDDGIVPPTSVSRPPSTSNSIVFSIPTSSESPIGGGTIHWRAVNIPSVCIVGGTGALGFGLALRLGRAGVPIVIGSRDQGRAEEAAGRAAEHVSSGSFTGLQNKTAARETDTVILSVPFRNQVENLANLHEVLTEGQLLIDATVPLAAAFGGKATRTLGVWQGSAAEQARELLPAGVGIVSAFHTVSAALLSDLDHRLDEDVLICGDTREEKERVAELVRRIEGLRPVDCGPLETARIVEQLTPLIISINVRNKVRAGIKITGL